MVRADAGLLEQARLYKSELASRLFGVEADAVGRARARPPGHSVVGLGFGAKVTGAGAIADLAVRVYVRAKLARAAVPVSERVPDDVNGLPTDVIPVGDIVARRPAVTCGVSIGHYKITAGTAGCLVTRSSAPAADHFVLSNNHVLANSNDAAIGDKILQPGPIDGGDPTDPIAELSDFEPVRFDGAPNAYDAAVARLIEPGAMTPDIPDIGRVAGNSSIAELYQSVRKHGRTTAHTVGVVMDLAADITVNYDKQQASYENQLGIAGVGGDFSAGGDSGSLIVDALGLQPVALLFAGGTGVTFGCPIEPILERFAATIE